MSLGEPERGSLAALWADLRRLHDHWMGVVYPRQVGARGTVLGKWRPGSTGGLVRYRLWAIVGVPIVAVLFPVALLGVFLRALTRRVDAAAGRLGALGVVIASGLLWGGLALLARARFSEEGFLAVVAAGVVATAAAVGALAFARIAGRRTTVLVAYPLATAGVCLPPVVAALYSPLLADVVFSGTTTAAVRVLERLPGAVASLLRAQFDLVGYAYVAAWTAVAVPVGWTAGAAVALADLVRPAD